jgi:hypothetical protein
MTCKLLDYSDRTLRPIELYKYESVMQDDFAELKVVLPPEQLEKVESGDSLGVYIIDNPVESFKALLTIWHNKCIACIDTGTGSVWGEWKQDVELLLTFEFEEGKDNHGQPVMGRIGYNIHGIKGIYSQENTALYTLLDEEEVEHWKKIWLSCFSTALIIVALTGWSPVALGMSKAIENGQQELMANPTKDMAEMVINVPEWFVQPPEDSVLIITAATGYSLDRQSAIDKAVLNAKAGLGNKVQSFMLEKMKRFISGINVKDNVELKKEAATVSDHLLSICLTGEYKVEKQEVVAHGNGYYAYVLVSFPQAYADRFLVEEIERHALLNTKLQSSNDYIELELNIRVLEESAR